MTYVPILKAKQAELIALSHVSPTVSSQLRPIIEVVPNHGRERDLDLLLERARKCQGQSFALGIDLVNLDDPLTPLAESGLSPLQWLGDAFSAAGLRCVPVFRPDDDLTVLADVGVVAGRHNSGAVLRVGGAEADPDPVYLASNVHSALDEARLQPTVVDLLIDLWEISSARDVTRVTPIATSVLDWALSFGRWRSITIASGAFPASISHLPTNTSTPVARFDAQMWIAVHTARPQVSLDFGDFAMAHPAVPESVPPRGPLPNLRYTHTGDWQVYRWRRTRPGNQDFHTLCEALTASAHWPSNGGTYSWGDQEIARCASGTGGAGTATQWLSYGFSHHLAHVTERLATLGAP